MRVTTISTEHGTGTPEFRRLSFWDQAYLGYQQATPDQSLDKGTLLFVDGPPPGDEEWRAHIAERLVRWPALRERLAPMPNAPREWAWVPDPDADLRYHAAVWAAPDGLTGRPAGLAAVDAIATTRLDLTRPPWRVFLVRDGRADGFTILYRANHVQQDGTAMHSALWMLFGPAGAPPPPGRLRPRPTRIRLRDLVADLAEAVQNPGGSNDLSVWGGRPEGPSRHHLAETDLPTLRRASRHHGVTINDVYLAALAGAVRAWSPAAWDPDTRPALHAAMPISIRPPSEQLALSNHSAVSWVPLPCGEPDRRRRLELVAARTRQIKKVEPGLLVRSLESRLRPSVIRRVSAAVARADARTGGKSPIQVSNPRGISGPLAAVGRPITGLVHLPLRLNGVQPLNVVLSGIDDQVGAGFTVAASVPDGGRIADLWLDEVHHLAGPAPAIPTAQIATL